MTNSSKFDSDKFQERLFLFARECRLLISRLPSTEYNKTYTRQLIRSSSSPGANYIEALEAMSRKDFVHRLRICRKEIRESGYWLCLIIDANSNNAIVVNKCKLLVTESDEIKRMLSSSIITIEGSSK